MSDSNTTAPGLTPVPGQSAPLSTLTPTDHSAIILIATAVGLVFSLISLLIRYFVRLEFRHHFAPDDVLASISMVFAVLQCSTVFVGVHNGYGKTIADVSDHGLVELQKATYAGDILYLVTIWLTKCSVASLFLRLSPNRGHNIMSYITLGASTVAAIISIFIISLRCDLSHPWIYINAQCINLLARWDVVGAFDIVTEIALFLTSVYMVKDLQLSFSKKTVVILAFGFRLPVVAPIILRLHYLNLQFHSSDMTFTGVLVQVMTQTQISYAIIAATIPCLRPFMTALSTHYGAPPAATANNSKYARGEYSLNSLSNNSKLSSSRRKKEKGLDQLREVSSQGSRMSIVRKDREEDESTHVGDSGSGNPRFRWDQHEHMTTVERGDGHSMESHESKQMIIQRNTEWVVQYERKDGGSASPLEEDIGVAHSSGGVV